MESGNTAALRFLLDTEVANVNEDMYYILGPLERAMQLQNMPMIRLLMSYGAEMSQIPAYSWDQSLTPLAFAAYKDNLRIMKLLLEHGYCLDDEETHDKENLPLQLAIAHNNTQMISLLNEQRSSTPV